MENEFNPFKQFAESREDFGGADHEAQVSGFRKLASVVYGFIYGGSLLNGVELGLEHVLNTDDTYLLGQWPVGEAAVSVACGALAGLLGSYSARSVISGVAASLLVSISALATKTALFQQPADSTAWVTAGLAVVIGTIAAYLPNRLPTYYEQTQEDIKRRAVFGVSWAHWLWLWLPWQGVIANGVWVAYPMSLQLGLEVSTFILIKELLKAPASIALVVWGCYKALESIRIHSELTRLQSCIRFVAWTLLFPIAVNLLRLI